MAHLRFKMGHLTYKAASSHLTIDCSSSTSCSGCDAGTSKNTLRVVFGTGITNGTCAHCTDLNGATFDLPVSADCRWRLTGVTPCNLTLSANFAAGVPQLQVVLENSIGQALDSWTQNTGSTNCAWSGLVIAPDGAFAFANCAGTPPSITVTAI